ncbi:hypothetical protein [Paraburkholderia phytofirmans]|uniref:hypothetical protein n=1 Tax=Paraburkholderia phytofirmans TaxID=261302 RepID=UPI0011DF7E8B|nr:hypothetical protein [Paraburkholderia phytofirmans]
MQDFGSPQGVDANVFHVPDAKLASLCISGMVRWVHRWYHPNGRLNSQEIAAKIATLGINMVGYRQQPPSVDDSVSG